MRIPHRWFVVIAFEYVDHSTNIVASILSLRLIADLRHTLDAVGPDRIPDRSTAYSLWALGTALEHCSVEVLLTAATALLLERFVSIILALLFS